LALRDAVFDPVEAHVNSFGVALFDSVVGHAGGTGLVSLDWSGWLGMAHLGEGGTKTPLLGTMTEMPGLAGFLLV
jgi:hypothetical protein